MTPAFGASTQAPDRKAANKPILFSLFGYQSQNVDIFVIEK